MRSLFLACLALLLIPSASRAQPRPNYGLPRGALIIETRPLGPMHPGRALVLWMLNPKKNPRDSSDDIYTCPEYTRGNYYSGPTRVSLVDLKKRQVINTLKVVDESMDTDSFDVPYRIRAGYYYEVPGARGCREGKPSIMRLRDYNGDGKALEFALFDAVACMGLETALLGYSSRQDNVIQYSIELRAKHDDPKAATRILSWCDYLFSKAPIRPGYWKYEIDYSGRGGTLDKYEIRYHPLKEIFEGTYVAETIP